MNEQSICPWVRRGSTNQAVLRDLPQPMTVTQIARRICRSRSVASSAARRLASQGLIRCLNPEAGMNRVYWLTKTGVERQLELRRELGLPQLKHDLPSVCWRTYGAVCTSHRAATIGALDEPRCPADIKRRARYLNSAIRMSANNVRDVIRALASRRVVVPVPDRKRSHPRYELTPLGQTLHALLLKAEVNPE